MIRKALMAAVLAVAGMSVTACNTVQGVGDDIKSVGRAGERAID